MQRPEVYRPNRRQLSSAVKGDERHVRIGPRKTFPAGLLLIIILGCFGFIVWLCTGGGN
jgi:hypothetical protein